MSAVTSREKTMLLVAVVAVLYAAAALSFKKQATNWKASQRLYASAQKKLQEERELIAAKDEWTAKYERLRGLMPVFPYDKDVDTHWLNIMDSTATRNGFTIARRQTSKEVEVGDVYELPIDCKDWEGTLESLVKFLYDLHQEGAMLDVRQLFVRPSNRPGFLKGTFTLYCAYMRGDEQKQAAGGRPQAGAPAEPEGGAATNRAAETVAEAPAPAAADAGATNPAAAAATAAGGEAR